MKKRKQHNLSKLLIPNYFIWIEIGPYMYVHQAVIQDHPTHPQDFFCTSLTTVFHNDKIGVLMLYGSYPHQMM